LGKEETHENFTGEPSGKVTNYQTRRQGHDTRKNSRGIQAIQYIGNIQSSLPMQSPVLKDNFFLVLSSKILYELNLF
jgi:hypothetical protein